MNDSLKYIWLEEINECNICCENYHDSFKCKRCIFLCCPKCSNYHYYLDDGKLSNTSIKVVYNHFQSLTPLQQKAI